MVEWQWPELPGVGSRLVVPQLLRPSEFGSPWVLAPMTGGFRVVADAQMFIQRLNQMNDAYTYRLPTEAEWEYACRAGTTGDSAGDLKKLAWYSDSSGNRTHAVGQKQPNPWGLADMHGNVWEWCQDWYHDSYYGAPTDGSAWLSGGGGEYKLRVLRGGSWSSYADYLRSAFRDHPPSSGADSVFRVVASARAQ